MILASPHGALKSLCLNPPSAHDSPVVRVVCELAIEFQDARECISIADVLTVQMHIEDKELGCVCGATFRYFDTLPIRPPFG
eukprot:5789074-Pyramimonas_sp.AAC.1